MKSNKNKIFFYDKVIILITYVLFAIKIVPKLQYTLTGTKWSLIYQAIFAIWLIFTVFKSGNWLKKVPISLFAIIVWLIYLTFQFFIYPDTQLGYLSLNLTFWEPLIIYIYIDTYFTNPKVKLIIADLVTLTLIVSIIYSIKSVNANEMAARIASSGHSVDDYIMTGNYSFTAMLTIIVGVAVGILKSKDKFFRKIIAGIFLGGTIAFIFKCNLMISILCLLISLSILPLLDNNKRVNMKKVYILIFMIPIILLSFVWIQDLIINLLLILSHIINTNEITNKINMIIIFLTENSQTGNLESRIELIKIAINTFFSNFLIGIGPQNNAEIYFKTKLGMHATFFDEFARYGIIGMTFMFNAFTMNYKSLVKKFAGSFALRTLRGGYITFVIISMFNPVLSANVGISLFYLLPVYSERLMKNNRSQDLEEKLDEISVG